MNKKLLELWTRVSTLLTIIAATPDNKDVLPLLPVAWQPYVIKAGLIATAILAIAAHYAPPTPSPLPEPKPAEPKP